MKPLPHDRPELATWAGGRPAEQRQVGHVGLVLPCYNEEGNVEELYERLVKVFEGLPDYTF